MTHPTTDPLWGIAEQVADCLSERGYAFVEDDKLGALAAALRLFLTDAGIPVEPADAIGVDHGSVSTSP